MKHLNKKLLSGTAVAIAGALLATEPAWSQIPEVIVKTRKREESLQSLPLSVSVLTSADIQKLGIDDVRDVAKFTPGIVFDDAFGPGDQRLVIRGLSPTRGRPNSAVLVDGIDFTTESVSTAGGSLLFDQRLLDVESIEVVKGPQSSLYGRAAFAGAVQYITKDPAEEFEGRVSLDMGDYGRFSVDGGVSGPVSDNFGLRVNALYWEEDGFYQDALTGGDLGGGEGYGVSASAKWEPSDSLTFRGRLSYADDEFDPQATIFFEANTFLTPPANAVAATDTDDGALSAGSIAGLFSGQVDDLGDRVPQLSANPRTGQPYEGAHREVFSATLTADWDVDFGTFSYLGGFLDGDSGQSIDGDQDVVPNADGDLDIARGGSELQFTTDTEIMSHELRFASNLDGPVQFTVGGLYWKEEVEQIETGVVVIPGPFDPSFPGLYNFVVPITEINPALVSRETEHWSAYAKVEWEITDQWKATVEGRYAEEDAEVSLPSCAVPDIIIPTPGDPIVIRPCDFSAPPLASYDPITDTYAQPATFQAMDSISDSYFAPKGILEWTPTDDALIFFSVAQGVKPAGISTIGGGGFGDANRDLRLDELKFDAEKLLTYELGAKTTWLDNTLRINGTVFFQDYSDKQIPIRRVVGGFPVPTIENAGKAEVFGVELDTLWQPDDNWTLALSYAYLDGEYTDFEFETDSTSNIARAGNCVLNNGGTPAADTLTDPTAPGNTDDLCLVSLNGATMEDIPEHAVTASIGYRNQLANTGIDWFAETNVQYQDERFADEYNDRGVDSFYTVDLRAGLEGENWGLLFYVNNLLDDDSFQNWTSGGGGTVETAEGTAFFPSSGFAFAPDPRHFGVRANIEF